MGRTAGQPARAAGADRSSVKTKPRPALEAVKPKAPTPPRAPAPPASGVAPSKSAPPKAHDGTVREILPPWEVIQQKLAGQNKGKATPSNPGNHVIDQEAAQALARQEAAAASWGVTEEAPSSGVRMSEPGPAASARGIPTLAGAEPAVMTGVDDSPAALGKGVVDDSLLSFKVYTVADLERRSDAPVSMRASINLDATASRSKSWLRALAALKAFAVASVAWFKIKGMRPSPKVALRKEFDAVGDELQLAIESIDWKKLGVTTGIVVGATLTLLFAVLTAAELTDDLKPAGAAAHLASAETSGIPSKTAHDARPVAPATNMAANGVQPVAPFMPPVTDGVIAGGELDDPVVTPTAKKPTAKRPAAAKPKASTKLTLRNAPF